MVDEGADLIDVGGESTRPGSSPVTVEVELKRIIPLIRRLSEEVSVPISVDTSKPEVMKAAVEAGAAMINDICALRMPGALEQAHVPGCCGLLDAYERYSSYYATCTGLYRCSARGKSILATAGGPMPCSWNLGGQDRG